MNESLFEPRMLNGFTIQPVWQRLDAELAGRIINLWQRHRILPRGANAQARVRDAVCVAFDPYGELAAVNSVFRMTHDDTDYYAYRIFIRPFNGEPQLKIVMTGMARQLLAAWPDPNRPSGLALVLENPRLRRDEVRDLLLLRGYRNGGLTASGQILWIYDFPNSKLSDRQ